MKKALLVVSFGTSFVNIIDSCIQPVEQMIAEALPEYDYYHAFTSRFIVRKLKEKYDMQINLPEEALTALVADGYEEIIVQPTHILPGFEYHKLKEEVVIFGSRHPEVKIIFGQSVLYENADYVQSVEALIASLPIPGDDEAVILMGHGTEHFSNAAYFALQHYLDVQTKGRMLVANVEAPPLLEEVIARLKQEQITEVWLTPFMLVAGDHANHDMAGEDEDSWVNVLAREGIHAKVILKGLGEYPAFRELYRKKALSNIE